eukprot:Clim_evm4s228 gene=Clim_evmTU4s228
MLSFCPFCANVLVVEGPEGNLLATDSTADHIGHHPSATSAVPYDDREDTDDEDYNPQHSRGNQENLQGRIRSTYALRCVTCPYRYDIRHKITSRRYNELKAIDEVMGGADAWENVDSTEAECPKCGNPRAYYRMMQTRSADEPMTVFYRCTNHECAHQWRE